MARFLKELFTAEELACLPHQGRRLELVQGKVYEMPLGSGEHGYIACNAGSLLGAHVRANGLGMMFAAETGFFLRRNPDTVRAPDAAFIAQERLPAPEQLRGYVEVAPDLVVEVVSPSDRAREVQDKVAEWLNAGVRLVWVIYPATRSAVAYRSMTEATRLSEDDTLDGGEVVPGFACTLREVLG